MARERLRRLAALLLLPAAGLVHAQAPVAKAAPGQVVVAGTVPDEATKAAVLARLRELYGADRVVDNIGVGSVVVPPNWANHVGKLLAPNLKAVSKGQLVIDGTNVAIRGEVASEAQRQQVVSEMATQLNPTYVVKNGLRVAASEQVVLDQTLANRIVEFERGSANLTPQGQTLLDEIAQVIKTLAGRKIEIIGHTDSEGSRAGNLVLSQARADAVKVYLQGKGIAGDTLSTSGLGPDRPVAANDTPQGRARNRRIEFRVSQ